MVNVQNNDEKCFKYNLLSKFVNPINNFRIGLNYVEEENKYSFSNITYSVQLKDIYKFEKINSSVLINIYSFKKGKPNYKNNILIKNMIRKILHSETSNQYIISYSF